MQGILLKNWKRAFLLSIVGAITHIAIIAYFISNKISAPELVWLQLILFVIVALISSTKLYLSKVK